jgi:DNA-binding CsgD family transcriptional regulator
MSTVTTTMATEIEILVRLTEREKEVLHLAAEGLPSNEIAERLFVSKRTVDFHLNGIYTKLGVRTRMQAIREAQRRGFL